MRPKIEAKILAAALRLFAANGYDRTTIRDIARGAGVPSASIYLKFGSKRDLHKEAVHAAYVGPRAPDRSPARADKHLPRPGTGCYSLQVEISSSLTGVGSQSSSSSQRFSTHVTFPLSTRTVPARRNRT